MIISAYLIVTTLFFTLMAYVRSVRRKSGTSIFGPLAVAGWICTIYWFW